LSSLKLKILVTKKEIDSINRNSKYCGISWFDKWKSWDKSWK